MPRSVPPESTTAAQLKLYALNADPQHAHFVSLIRPRGGCISLERGSRLRPRRGGPLFHQRAVANQRRPGRRKRMPMPMVTARGGYWKRSSSSPVK